MDKQYVWSFVNHTLMPKISLDLKSLGQTANLDLEVTRLDDGFVVTTNKLEILPAQFKLDFHVLAGRQRYLSEPLERFDRGRHSCYDIREEKLHNLSAFARTCISDIHRDCQLVVRQQLLL